METIVVHRNPPHRILGQALNRFRRTTTSSTMGSCVCSGAGEGAGSISSISTSSSSARDLFLDGLGLVVVCEGSLFCEDPVLRMAFGVSGSSRSISSSSSFSALSSSSSMSVSLSESVSVSIPSWSEGGTGSDSRVRRLDLRLGCGRDFFGAGGSGSLSTSSAPLLAPVSFRLPLRPLAGANAGKRSTDRTHPRKMGGGYDYLCPSTS